MGGRTCFVIAPIDKDGSAIRERSDQVLENIIKPAVKECGYQPRRADEISKTGSITNQIIERLVDDDLVIADLTGANVNVFYELAIRHFEREPVIQLIQADQKVPFDVQGERTIPINHESAEGIRRAKELIVAQIKELEDNSAQIGNPIGDALDLREHRRAAASKSPKIPGLLVRFDPSSSDRRRIQNPRDKRIRLAIRVAHDDPDKRVEDISVTLLSIRAVDRPDLSPRLEVFDNAPLLFDKKRRRFSLEPDEEMEISVIHGPRPGTTGEFDLCHAWSWLGRNHSDGFRDRKPDSRIPREKYLARIRVRGNDVNDCTKEFLITPDRNGEPLMHPLE